MPRTSQSRWAIAAIPLVSAVACSLSDESLASTPAMPCAGLSARVAAIAAQIKFADPALARKPVPDRSVAQWRN